MKTMTTPNTTPRTDAFYWKRTGIAPVGRSSSEWSDFARQLETELNEAKDYSKRQEQFLQRAYLCTCICHNNKERNAISCPVCLQKQLLTTQAECAAMRKCIEWKLELIQDTQLAEGQKCFCPDGTCWVCVARKALSTTAGKELLEKRDQLRAQVEELLSENKSMLARMDECGYPEMLAKQNELMKIALSIDDCSDCNCDSCAASRAKLTAFN